MEWMIKNSPNSPSIFFMVRVRLFPSVDSTSQSEQPMGPSVRRIAFQHFGHFSLVTRILCKSLVEGQIFQFGPEMLDEARRRIVSVFSVVDFSVTFQFFSVSKKPHTQPPFQFVSVTVREFFEGERASGPGGGGRHFLPEKKIVRQWFAPFVQEL
jgi:hypothetical protein